MLKEASASLVGIGKALHEATSCGMPQRQDPTTFSPMVNVPAPAAKTPRMAASVYQYSRQDPKKT